ncbi:putative reverse transcriptase domain, reverse transcriptase zinc-binding domain protein [Tanacetum coccineum]
MQVTELRNSETVNGAAVAIPLDVVEEVSSRFVNTLYGYFIGLSIEGMESVMEHRPWLIRRMPLMLNIWTPNTVLKKEEVKHAPLWVKLHHIPIVAYSEVGLSLISTQLGKPIMMDSYTSNMCLSSWGRSTYARILIEVSAENELMESLVIAIPLSNGKGHTLATIKVEYEWQPPRCAQLPWCILGDFNAALFLHDSSAGNSKIDISMREFKECVEEIEVMDIQNSGLQFTWSQKPKGNDGLLKKIDRIMVNLSFNDSFVGAHAIFKPYRISDHSPSILNIPTVTKPKPKPFKFYNLITCHERFKQVVMEGWSKQVSGFHMFRVAYKLKNLKKPLRKLLYDKGNLHTNVNQLRDELDRVQTRLDLDPFNVAIRQEEATVLAAFNEACLMEEKFLKQKSKIDWLKEGDSNSAYFHKAVKSRVSRSRIDVVTNADGIMFENDNVADAFVSHYESFLGQPGTTSGFNDFDLFRVKLDEHEAIDMTRTVSRQEVKSALFSMGNDKALGPDGKIIANRIKESLKVLVSPNQSAFVPGRTYDIVDLGILKNILIGFGFHDRMVGWIMECVTTTSYSISINGSLHGFFKGKRGLRQGDPLSPYLFTLIMEVLPLMLQTRYETMLFFYLFHRYCMNLELINLCLRMIFLFAHGEVDSSGVVIKECLFDFKRFGAEGRLPVKYLGVPLVSSRLIFRDCKGLLEKVQARTDDWKNKSLSAAGRLQLFFIGFGSSIVLLGVGGGGLGVRRLDLFNKALMVSHIWKLLSLKESLWVKWVHSYKLKSNWWMELQILYWFVNCVPLSRYEYNYRLIGYRELGLSSSSRKSSRSIIAKLVMAASAYFIWQERNARLFKNSKRLINQVIEVIFSRTVSLAKLRKLRYVASETLGSCMWSLFC